MFKMPEQQKVILFVFMITVFNPFFLKCQEQKIFSDAYISSETQKSSIYVELSKRVITPSRAEEYIFDTNRSVSVIDKKTLAESNSITLPDSLLNQPGIWIPRTTQGHGTLNVRGFMGRENLVLIDGVRLNNSTFRSGNIQYLNTIDAFQIENVEIVRGPGSVLYGSDALGGVINVITGEPDDFSAPSSLKTEITSKYRSADNGMAYGIGMSGNLSRLGYNLGGTYKKFGDIRAGGDIGEESPTDYNEASGYMKLLYGITSSQKISLSYQQIIQNNIPRYDKYVGSKQWPVTSGNYEKYLFDPQNRYLLILGYENNDMRYFVDSVKTNLSFHRQKEGIKSRKSGSTKLNENSDLTDTLGASLQLTSILNNKNILTYGTEYYSDEVDSKMTTTNLVTGVKTNASSQSTFPDGSQYDSLGVYLQHRMELNDCLAVIAGGRYARFNIESVLRNPPLSGDLKETFDLLTGSLGLSYKYKEKWNLIANISQGFRAPNLTDTVVLQTTNQGVDVPSEGLEPEKSVNYEIGIKKTGRFSGSYTYYISDLDDLIERKKGLYSGKNYIDSNNNNIKDAGEADVYQKFNIGKAMIQGFEMESSYSLNTSWLISGNLSWVFGENNTDNEPLSYIPPMNGSLSLKWTNESNKYWAECSSLFAGRQDRYSTRDKADPRMCPSGTPGWGIGNIYFGFSPDKYTKISIGVENLFDHPYRIHGSGVDAPGRNITAGIVVGF
ncbi:MAG: Colicin I receptor precursor [Elusimicrobia bacterium ADurb.Bin231]|nr:MAG: Colicin I receptor precursor [Elusimicrobia bacterium ADurb.Bin231]